MKGTIQKINDNWMVILDKRTWQDPSAEDLILPLHIDDLWVIDHTGYIGEKQELNFQILTVEEGVIPCGTHIIYKDYAKLILKENHIVETNEMVDQVPDVRKMVDDDKESFLLWVRRNYERCKTGWIDLETGNKHRIEADLVYEYYQLHPTSSQTEISDEEMVIGRFMNWFLKHYSTATIDGFFGYVNAMGQEVRIQDILKEYRKFNSNGNKGSEIATFQTISEKWKEYQDWLNEVPEISDEDIRNKSMELFRPVSYQECFEEGAKWYREQLKKKQ